MYVCITAGEWRNLCSTGRIRLHESRAVSSSGELEPESFNALVSVAPDRFSIGETSDFLITECRTLQPEIEGVRPPGFQHGIQWLLLEDVIRFFPLRADDAWSFESDAQKARVVLDKAAFESLWEQWFKCQIVDQAWVNGLTLMRALVRGFSSDADARGLLRWRVLAEKIVAPDKDGPDNTDFYSNFLKSRDRLFDLVREDVDRGSFFISCPIEWVNLRSDTNILEVDAALAEQAHGLHEKYWNVPFAPSLFRADDLASFAALLRAKVPDAFPDKWSPATISLYVRHSHRIRFGSVAPDEIVGAVHAIETADDGGAAEFMAFLLGVALGSNKTHSLERSLHHGRFKVALAPPTSVVPSHQMAGSEPALVAGVDEDHALEGRIYPDPGTPDEGSIGMESASLEPKNPGGSGGPETLRPPNG